MKIIRNALFILFVSTFVIFASLLAYYDNSVPSKVYSYETKYYYEEVGEFGTLSTYSLKEAEIDLVFSTSTMIKLSINEDAEDDDYASPIKVYGTYEIEDGYLYVDFEDLHIYECIGKINAYTFNPNSNFDNVFIAILMSENRQIKSPISDLEYCFDSDEIVYENEDKIELRQTLVVLMTVSCVLVIVCVIWSIIAFSKTNKSKAKAEKNVAKIENNNSENV